MAVTKRRVYVNGDDWRKTRRPTTYHRMFNPFTGETEDERRLQSMEDDGLGSPDEVHLPIFDAPTSNVTRWHVLGLLYEDFS